MSFLGDVLDNVGTAFNLPEFGLSEHLAGGNKTVNTGRVDYTPTGGIIGTPTSQAAYNNALKQTPRSGDILPYDGGRSAVPVNRTGGTGNSDTNQLDLGGAIGSYYGGTGAVARPARDPAAEAMYQSGIDQTNNLLGQIGSRRDTALQGLLGSYNTSKQRAQNAFKDYESDYTTSTDRMTRQNAQKKSQIDSTVRNNITALQRLLASRGAGSSSAAQFAVPSAVAQKGTSDRYDAQQTFNDNMYHKIHTDSTL